MIYATDVCGVYGVYLIVKGNGGEIKDKWLYHAVFVLLTGIFLGAWFNPDRGVRCHLHYPIGLTVIITFYIFWSLYVFCKLRDPNFLAPPVPMTEEEHKEAVEKMEALPIKDRPYEPVLMVKKQKMNFVFSTICCLLSQILLIGTSLLGLYLHDSWSDFLESECINDGW